jgi:hypothetical protein
MAPQFNDGGQERSNSALFYVGGPGVPVDVYDTHTHPVAMS